MSECELLASSRDGVAVVEMSRWKVGRSETKKKKRRWLIGLEVEEVGNGRPGHKAPNTGSPK